jgi:F-type H+-transporting ATPase subunit delta
MSLLAKRYVKALSEEFDIESIKELRLKFSALAKDFSDVKVRTTLLSNLTSKADKEGILLSIFEGCDVKVQNFIKLLVEKNRVSEIPAIAEELRVLVANANNKFEGKLLSSTSVSIENLKAIADGLSKKLGKNIVLTASKSEINGIKVIVDDLNVDVTLSRSRIEADMINHILKAI